MMPSAMYHYTHLTLWCIRTDWLTNYYSAHYIQGHVWWCHQQRTIIHTKPNVVSGLLIGYSQLTLTVIILSCTLLMINNTLFINYNQIEQINNQYSIHVVYYYQQLFNNSVSRSIALVSSRLLGNTPSHWSHPYPLG